MTDLTDWQAGFLAGQIHNFRQVAATIREAQLTGAAIADWLDECADQATTAFRAARDEEQP